MLPTIVDGATTKLRSEYVLTLVTPHTELLHLTSDTSSIKIKDIITLQSQLSITPRLPRIIWIEEANLLTPPAQNALLKLLEEPPRQASFYLTCDSHQSLLPTIRSRCSHLALATSAPIASTILADLKVTLAQSPGARLANIPKLDRPQAIQYFHQLEAALKEQLSSGAKSIPQYKFLAQLAHGVQLALEQLTHNVGVTLVYESFLLHLPKTK